MSHDLTRPPRIELFDNLTSAQIAKVTAVCEEESYQPGRFIFEESDLSEDMFIVVEGEVDLGHELDRPGLEDRLYRITAGEIFGEMSLFDGLPRSMDAMVAVETRLLRIKKEKWEKLVHTEKDLGIFLMKNLARIVCFRLRTTNWDLALIKSGFLH